MNPRVRDVVPKDDYKLEITFTNGEIGIYDCAHLVNFGVFSEFQDVRYFRRARVEHGTVVWPNEQDICPDTLYVDSTKVSSMHAETDAGKNVSGTVFCVRRSVERREAENGS